MLNKVLCAAAPAALALLLSLPWIAGAGLSAHGAADQTVGAAQEQAAGTTKDEKSEEARTLNPRQALAAQSKFAFSLLKELAKGAKAGENLVASPASLASVFGVLDLGADAALRASIHRMLGFSEGSDSAADLAGLRATARKLGAEKGGALALANAIVFDPTAKPLPEAVAKLKGFDVDVSVEDLSKPETIERINQWVSAQTQEMISGILEAPLQNAGLVALNALYFKDRWAKPFNPEQTAPQDFKLVEGGTLKLPMMHIEKLGERFHTEGNFVGVDLPYANERFALALVTTLDKPAALSEFAPALEWLGGGFGTSDGTLALPRFTLEARAELLEALDALGLEAGRNSPTAFTALSPVGQQISRVVQRTVLRVDEAGTEAAAASAVATGRSLAPRQGVAMIVDKPFLFALRDRSSGLILLAGYVAKPKAIEANAR